ncbi:MAG: AMP-binding protein [Proteobacteria bacterium]|nr:AMP-binding protein [Pseudomonadota bacterium]
MRVIGDIVRLNAKRFPNKKAVIMEDKYLTFLQLNQQANQLARGLVSMGLKSGDRVAVLAFNSLEWIIITYALAKCGGVIVPVNFRYKREELIYAINNSESSIVFFGQEFAAMVEDVRTGFNAMPRLIAISGEPVDAGLSLRKLMDGQSTSEPDICIDPNWPLSITYTSGTTGTPKGVQASHSAFMNIYTGMVVEGDVEDNEITLVGLPFFHVAGMHALIQPTFFRGGTAVIMGAGFDPEVVLDTVARYHITMTLWVPTQLAMLINHPAINKYNVSSLKKIWYGSSPITPPVLEGCLERFKADFYQFYGQTETGMVSVLRPEDHRGGKAQFTGREFFNSDLRFVDEDGQGVEIGEVGEIVSRQEGLGMIGYYKMDEANKATIRDGWIHTGDLARLEGNGYFTIVDRIKDMIISGAENIYPKEIEDIISRYPGVREVAVFGIPDDIYGESVCAAIVRDPGNEFTQEEVIKFCADKLSSYKKPKRVEFMNELPKNAFGKVTKNILREPFWAGRKKRI